MVVRIVFFYIHILYFLYLFLIFHIYFFIFIPCGGEDGGATTSCASCGARSAPPRRPRRRQSVEQLFETFPISDHTHKFCSLHFSNIFNIFQVYE